MTDPSTPAPEAAAAPSVPSPVAPAAPPVVATPAPAAATPRALNPWANRAPSPPPAAPAASAQPDPMAALRADVESLRGFIGRTVEQDLSGAPANVAAAVRAVSADPVEQRRILDVMRANGLAAAPTAPVAMPANTAPTAPTPAPSAAAQSDAAIFATYEQLRKAAPIRAQVYRAQHGDAIARASRTAS